MNGMEMREIRQRLGYVQPHGRGEADFARLLGYNGNYSNRVNQIKKMESGSKEIPLYIAKLVWLLGQVHDDVAANSQDMWPGYIDDDGAIDWPDWAAVNSKKMEET